MNRKIFSNKVIFLLVVILGLAYFYLNLPENFKIQLGGSSGPPIPSECIPFTYKYRYLLYFGIVFAIIFALFSYISVSKLSSMGYRDYIKKSLDQYTIDAKNIKDAPQEKKIEIEALLNSFKGRNQYSTYGSAFCSTVAPCSCCNEPGYYNPECPAGSPGSKPKTPTNTTA